MEQKIVELDEVSRIILYGVMKQTNGDVLRGVNYEVFRHAVRNCISNFPALLSAYREEISKAFSASRKPKEVSHHFTDNLKIMSFYPPTGDGGIETVKIDEGYHPLTLEIVEKFDSLAKKIGEETLNIARRIAISLDKYTPISNIAEYEIKHAEAVNGSASTFVQFQNEQGAILIDYITGRRYLSVYKLGLFEIQHGFKKKDRFASLEKRVVW